LVVALAALAFPMFSASAQDADLTKTVTITEADLNSLYLVTNPIHRGVTNASFDIQDAQVVFSATLDRPGYRGPCDALATYTPAVTDGRIDWTLASLTINGSPATDDQMQDFSLGRVLGHPLWRAYMEHFIYPRYEITGISISGDAITITYTRKSSV